MTNIHVKRFLSRHRGDFTATYSGTGCRSTSPQTKSPPDINVNEKRLILESAFRDLEGDIYDFLEWEVPHYVDFFLRNQRKIIADISRFYFESGCDPTFCLGIGPDAWDDEELDRWIRNKAMRLRPLSESLPLPQHIVARRPTSGLVNEYLGLQLDSDDEELETVGASDVKDNIEDVDFDIVQNDHNSDSTKEGTTENSNSNGLSHGVKEKSNHGNTIVRKRCKVAVVPRLRIPRFAKDLALKKIKGLFSRK